jgi:tRNA A-37 threonylcarbamoyl transferase component Bud32
MSFRPPLSVAAGSSAGHPCRLGKYTLTGVLGEGAMGTVYKGFDPTIRRPVAVKAIRRHLFEPASLNVSAAERFRNEAQAAGRLTHPGIVGVYEYGEEDGGAFLAMEYVEGHGLNHYIAPPARLPERDALCVMMQLLEALHCAHEQGVWHRDIKPNNIIVTPEGKLKIADFGIARIESAALTQMTMLIGSPGYIAPERYTGEAPDRRVDIFSCGVLLYQMLTGVAPFVGTDTEVMYKVLHSDPTPPSRAAVMPPPPDCWDAIVAKALAKRPDDRYATAREFRDALFCAAPWPMPATLSSEVIDGVERRLADEAATLTQVRMCAQPSASPCVAAPAASPAQPALQPARPMSKECAELAELVAQLAAQAQAREQRRASPESVATQPLAALADASPAPAAAPVEPQRALPPPAPCAPPTLVVPVTRRTPPTPEVIAKAQRVLAGHIGPIARLMVKNAASIAATREQFYVVLADLAADCVDRELLLGELSRIA